MPTKQTDVPVSTGDDLADVRDAAGVESGAGEGDQPADVGAMLYPVEQRREFLIEAMKHPESQRFVDDPKDPYVFGIARTEYQFKRALCDYGYPRAAKLSREDMQALMAEELKSMGAV